jgi:seryl-tRNA synthetase
MSLMHDPRVLLDPATEAVRKLARRGYQLDLAELDKLLSQRNATIRQVDDARAESKRIAGEVRDAGKRGVDTAPLVERARALKAQITDSEHEQRRLDEELRVFLLGIPNLPEDRSPDGGERRRCSTSPRSTMWTLANGWASSTSRAPRSFPAHGSPC